MASLGTHSPSVSPGPEPQAGCQGPGEPQEHTYNPYAFMGCQSSTGSASLTISHRVLHWTWPAKPVSSGRGRGQTQPWE